MVVVEVRNNAVLHFSDTLRAREDMLRCYRPGLLVEVRVPYLGQGRL